jgi:hypothetical protein
MAKKQEQHSHGCDPTRKISINVPFLEPLMRQIEYLLEVRARPPFIGNMRAALA